MFFDFYMHIGKVTGAIEWDLHHRFPDLASPVSFIKFPEVATLTRSKKQFQLPHKTTKM
jgi:hypothetical protein